jgi:peroxiredoxin
MNSEPENVANLSNPAVSETSMASPKIGFRKRLLVLPIAAVVIVGLCSWKLSRPTISGRGNRSVEIRRQQSPRFELIDQNKRLVKFERYLHRHRIVLVFFDATKSPDQDERLVQLRQGLPRLRRNETVVVGVSGGLPQENRQGTVFPFPLLTDLKQRDAGSHYLVHKQWGSYDPATNRPEFKMFLIDRKGTVAWDGDKPRPIRNATTVINALINGQDPDV